MKNWNWIILIYLIVLTIGVGLVISGFSDGSFSERDGTVLIRYILSITVIAVWYAIIATLWGKLCKITKKKR